MSRNCHLRQCKTCHGLAFAQVYNSASMKRALERLVTDGLVYNYENEYRFVNPFFGEWIKRG